MRLYTVHLRRHGLVPERDVAVVREGFNFWAFLFGAVWALCNRLWLVALGIFLAQAALNGITVALGAPPPVEIATALGLAVLIGLRGNDLKRWTLRRRGFVESAVVAGADAEAAEYLYYSRHPGLAADLLR